MTEAAEEETLTDSDIAAGNLRSDEIFADLVNQINDSEEDAGVILYSLWLRLTCELVECEWAGEDLVKQVAVQVAMYESSGTA